MYALNQKLKSQLIDEINPKWTESVFISGSRIDDLATTASDLDIYVISNRVGFKNKYRFGSLQVEVQTIHQEQLDRLKMKINGLSSKGYLDFWEQHFCYLIKVGQPLYNSSLFQRFQDDFDWTMLRSWMVQDRLRAFRSLNKEVIRTYGDGDYDTSVLCSRHAIDHLIDAFLFMKDDLAVKEKWRLKKLRRTAPELYEQYCNVQYFNLSKSLEYHITEYKRLYQQLCELLKGEID